MISNPIAENVYSTSSASPRKPQTKWSSSAQLITKLRSLRWQEENVERPSQSPLFLHLEEAGKARRMNRRSGQLWDLVEAIVAQDTESITRIHGEVIDNNNNNNNSDNR